MIVAYHFWSPTCGPCKVIKPAIEDLHSIKQHTDSILNDLAMHQTNKRMSAEAMKPANELNKAIGELSKTLNT